MLKEVLEMIKLERKGSFNKSFELVDKLIEKYGEENLTERLYQKIGLEWDWEIVADLFGILIWSTNDNGASIVETAEQWLLEGSDLRKINIALHLDAYPFAKKEQMQEVLSHLSTLYPEIAEHCSYLISSRNDKFQ
jgi:hypothetical protein